MIHPCKFRWLSFALLGSAVSCATAQRLAADADTFVYQCDGAEQAIVVTTDGARGYLFSHWVSEPLQREDGTSVYRGEDTYYLPVAQPADIAPGQTAEITIQGNRLAGCKNNLRAAIWEGAKLRGVSFRAVGQEPPWVLEIDRQYGFFLTTGYDKIEQRFPYTEPVTDSNQHSAHYSAESNGDGIAISITGEPCRDTMSGAEFSSRVEIAWREQILRGCGRPLH
jgi:uncharacterized membrane protein